MYCLIKGKRTTDPLKRTKTKKRKNAISDTNVSLTYCYSMNFLNYYPFRNMKLLKKDFFIAHLNTSQFKCSFL